MWLAQGPRIEKMFSSVLLSTCLLGLKWERNNETFRICLSKWLVFSFPVFPIMFRSCYKNPFDLANYCVHSAPAPTTFTAEKTNTTRVHCTIEVCKAGNMNTNTNKANKYICTYAINWFIVIILVWLFTTQSFPVQEGAMLTYSSNVCTFLSHMKSFKSPILERNLHNSVLFKK